MTLTNGKWQCAQNVPVIDHGTENKFKKAVIMCRPHWNPDTISSKIMSSYVLKNEQKYLLYRIYVHIVQTFFLFKAKPLLRRIGALDSSTVKWILTSLCTTFRLIPFILPIICRVKIRRPRCLSENTDFMLLNLFHLDLHACLGLSCGKDQLRPSLILLVEAS